MDPKLGFLRFFKFASLVFLDIAQDCSLGQCLTSRAETFKKFFGPNDLFCSHVVGRPVKLACLFKHLLFSYEIGLMKSFLHRVFVISSN